MPSQCVLTKTIKESKHALYTICNKILMQLSTKLGGEPWAITDLPYFCNISMAIGIHVTKTQVCVVSSINQTCSRYWSKAKDLP